MFFKTYKRQSISGESTDLYILGCGGWVDQIRAAVASTRFERRRLRRRSRSVSLEHAATNIHTLDRHYIYTVQLGYYALKYYSSTNFGLNLVRSALPTKFQQVQQLELNLVNKEDEIRTNYQILLSTSIRILPEFLEEN